MGLNAPEDELLKPAVTPDAINARSEATVAAMAAVREEIDDADPEQAAVARDLLRDLSHRAKQADQIRQDSETGTQRLEMQLRLRLTAIEAARAKLLADHKDELDTDAMGTLVAELDLEEQQIRTALGER